MFYEIRLKVIKTDDKGEEKEVREHYITDCELFAEAEAKGLEMYPSCDVSAITRSKVIEIVNGKTEDKPFFKATVTDVQYDDKGKAKELKYYNLVCAEDLKEANTLMERHLAQGLSGMRLDAIVKTRIKGVI